MNSNRITQSTPLVTNLISTINKINKNLLYRNLFHLNERRIPLYHYLIIFMFDTEWNFSDFVF